MLVISSNLFPQITWTNLPFLKHAQIEAAATAGMESLHRIRLTESDAELETGHARLSHHDQGPADPELIADAHRPFIQPLSGEVLAEPSRLQQQIGIFFLPKRVMLRRIDVHRLIPAAVHRQVGLLIAFEPKALLEHVERYAVTRRDDDMIAADPHTRNLLALADKVAETDATVLLTGESGSYTVNNDTIQFGPGKAEHKGIQLRGALPAMEAPTVYLTGFTPFKHTITLR